MAWRPTQAQRSMLRSVYRHQRLSGGWYRAQHHGERVTLASLYYRGLLERQVWSGEGTSSPAHEYRVAPELATAVAAKVQA